MRRILLSGVCSAGWVTSYLRALAAVVLSLGILSILPSSAMAKGPSVNQQAYLSKSSGLSATFYVATSTKTFSYNSKTDGSVFKQPAIMVALTMDDLVAFPTVANDLKWLPPTQYPSLQKIMWDFSGASPNLIISVASPVTKTNCSAYADWAVDYLVRLRHACYSKSSEQVAGFKFTSAQITQTTFYWFIGDFRVEISPNVRTAVITNQVTNEVQGTFSSRTFAQFKTRLGQALAASLA